MDQVLMSLIGVNLSLIAGMILLQIQSWRAIGRIEGQLNNGLIKRLDQVEEVMKKCIKHT